MSLSIRELVVKPWEANEVRLMCPHCSRAVYVTLPWNVTAAQRQQAISDGITEHRRVCVKAPAEAGRVFRIEYPRG